MNRKFSIEILRSAQKQLNKIDRQDQERVIETIRGLAENPRPHGVKKLKGNPAWRIRVGIYRIIYEIYDDKFCIIVIALGHRKDIYR